MKKTKSPLTDKPLRNPGQSLEDQIDTIVNDQLTTYVLLPALLILMSIMEWMHWYFDTKPSPFLISLIALISIVYSTYKILKIRKKLQNLKQGRDGEKAVGQYLELFREQGMKIFHDIVGDGFNIDHLIISAKGIYIIETKTYSKPLKGKTEITFDGQNISINGQIYNDDIIIQVTAATTWISNLIEELTARKFAATPVVLFPGWYVKMTNKYKSPIWVLNPKSLNTFIYKQKDILSKEDIKLISNHVTRYIRNKEL